MMTDAGTLNAFIAEDPQDTLDRCAAASELLGQLFVDLNQGERINPREASALSLFGRCIGAALRYEVQRCALERSGSGLPEQRASA